MAACLNYDTVQLSLPGPAPEARNFSGSATARCRRAEMFVTVLFVKSCKVSIRSYCAQARLEIQAGLSDSHPKGCAPYSYVVRVIG